MTTITPAELATKVGEKIGTSEWILVDQEMINKFADATGDHQFIHVNEEMAKMTPFGGTIAHGFLTLSLLSTMTYETLPPLEGGGMAINQGFDSIRFITPVKTGSRIRTRFVLADTKVRPSGWVHVNYDVAIEIENLVKPALTARWLTVIAPKDPPQ